MQFALAGDRMYAHSEGRCHDRIGHRPGEPTRAWRWWLLTDRPIVQGQQSDVGVGEELQRVDIGVAAYCAPMQARIGSAMPTVGPQRPDHLSGGNPSTGADRRVDGLISGAHHAMADADHTHPAHLTGVDDDPISRRMDRRIRRCGEINATVAGQPGLIGRVEAVDDRRWTAGWTDWDDPRRGRSVVAASAPGVGRGGGIDRHSSGPGRGDGHGEATGFWECGEAGCDGQPRRDEAEDAAPQTSAQPDWSATASGGSPAEREG